MKRNSWLLIASLGLTLLSACARDRDTDDYRRDKLEEDLAKLDAITGTYTGHLIANKDGRDLGVVGLQLEADTRIGSLNEEIPVLKGALLFQSSSILKVVFLSSNFNSETNVFRMSVRLKTSVTNDEYDLDLLGVPLADGVINAKLESFGYGEYGASMRLERTVSSQSFDEIFSRPVNPGAPSYGTLRKFYKGKTQAGKSIALTINNVGMTVEDRFLGTFLPNRPIEASLTMAEGLVLTFPTAYIEVRDSSISATQNRQTGNETYTTTLNCSRTGMSAGRERLHCRYTSTLTNLTLEMDLNETDSE